MDGSEREFSAGLPEDLAWHRGLRKATEDRDEERAPVKIPLMGYFQGNRLHLGDAVVEERADGFYVSATMDSPLVEEILGSPSEMSVEPPIKLSAFNKIYPLSELSEEERIAKWRITGSYRD